MPVTDAYATAAQYRTGLSPGKSDTSSDAEILNDLTAISRILERELGRFFTRDASDVARTFYPQSRVPAVNPEAENPFNYGSRPRLQRWLTIPDLSAAPTSIIIDTARAGTFPGAALASTDYELFPQDAAFGAEARPYNAIYLPLWSSNLGFLPQARVHVTGRWGWPSVPLPIQRATIQLTAILRLESPRASSSISEGTGAIIGMSKIAQDIITRLSRQYKAPGAIL